MLYDSGARLMSAGAGASVTRVAAAGSSHRVRLGRRRDRLGVRAALHGTPPARRRARGAWGAGTGGGGAGTPLTLVARGGCTPFPEAGVDATVHRAGDLVKHGRIFGFIDDHVHITGNMRAGGDVISGEPYDRVRHPGRARPGREDPRRRRQARPHRQPAAQRHPDRHHDTHGWPTFKGWPTYNSMTHQQAYYVWLRARVARRAADGGRPDRRRRAAVPARAAPPDEDVLGDDLDRGPDPHAEGDAGLRRRPERRSRHAAGSGSSTAPRRPAG